jgi:hypothetical protein
MRILSIITAACALGGRVHTQAQDDATCQTGEIDMKLITLSLVALALSATTALAQTTQFYGPSGQYQGSANRFGNTTTFYGPAGQYQGSTNTFGNTTTYYGSTGQYQGSGNSFGGGLNNNFGNNSRRGFGGF